MLNLHATTSPNSLLAATPLPAATPAFAEGGGAPSAFARMLQGSQPPAASAPPAPPAPPAPQATQRNGEQKAQQEHAERNIDPKTERHSDHPHEPQGDAAAHGQAPAANAASQAANRPGPTGREAARGRDEAKRAQTSRTGSAQAATAQTEAAQREAAADKKDELATQPDPALADWLASLKLPEPPQAAQGAALALPANATATATAAADPNNAGASGTAPASAATTPGADAAAATAAGQAATLASGLPATAGSTAGGAAATSTGRERPSDPSVRGATQPEGQASDPAGAALAAAARPGAGDGQSPSNGGGNAGNPPPAWTPVASTAPTAATLAPAPVTVFTVPAGRSQADPVAVNLPVPVDSPAFPRAMGVELSVLARDGIEHAELHLSPAEMGPVSVQIAIDGTQARIDFGADVAATRQAIEAGLPELASALREAGLTLTGGGVSQHSRGQQNPADTPASGRGNGGPADAGTGESAAPPPRRFVRAGGVDMYA